MIVYAKNNVIINTGTARPLWSKIWQQYYCRGAIWNAELHEWSPGMRVVKLGKQLREAPDPSAAEPGLGLK